MIATIGVRHYEHVSSTPFNDVVAALEAATGSVQEGFGRVAAEASDASTFEKVFRAREGSSGFMRFDTIDHGKWLDLVGQPAKAIMYIIGNPLIAKTMLAHDIRVGLNVPVRIFIYQHGDGSTRVAYDLPSSLMSGLQNSAVSDAAYKLDAKLIALAEEISGVAADKS
jgi:uncharacterized protein (DUF302 family)